MSTDEAGDPPAAPSRLTVRSPVEAYLWIFITRLIALLTATRIGPSAGAPSSRSEPDPADAPPAVDPDRTRRVAASRGPAGAAASTTDREPQRPLRSGPDATTRAVVATAAATVVAGAAAFAAGRRSSAR